MAKGSLDYLKEQLDELEAQGLRQHPRTLEGEQGARARFDGRDVINLASNNYLGLAAHPKLKEAAAKAAMEFGAGSGAVRTIAGTMTLHRELERRFAAFKGAEAALMFQSGFTSNAGTVAAILSPEDVIVSDQLNHASIIDGARLSRAEIKVFPHKDVEAADQLLAETREGRPAPAADHRRRVLDGRRHRAARRPGGRGRPARRDHDGRRRARLGRPRARAARAPSRTSASTRRAWTSRSARCRRRSASWAGSSPAPPHLIDWLVNRGRPYLFSTSAPPPVAAACIAALDVIEAEPERIDRLWENTRFLKQGLDSLGFDTGMSETPITPVIAGEAQTAQDLSRLLFEEGVFTPAIVFPTVPKGQSRVRTIVTAEHTQDDLQQALDAFERVGRKLALIS